MREYGREAGNLLVGLQLDPQAARFNSQPVKGLSGQTDVPMLDAIATRDPGSRKYALYVVNRSLNAAVRTSIKMNLPAGVTGTVSVLNGPSYTSRNTADNPTLVNLSTVAFGGGGSFSYDFPAHSMTVFRWQR
jgi:alpha-L-arabinofuranosidase